MVKIEIVNKSFRQPEEFQPSPRGWEPLGAMDSQVGASSWEASYYSRIILEADGATGLNITNITCTVGEEVRTVGGIEEDGDVSEEDVLKVGLWGSDKSLGVEHLGGCLVRLRWLGWYHREGIIDWSIFERIDEMKVILRIRLNLLVWDEQITALV